MTYTPPDYHTARTIGEGQSNAADVRRLRRALTRTGYGRFGNPPAENVTPGLMQTIERFQSDFGLKPDAVIRPGARQSGLCRWRSTPIPAVAHLPWPICAMLSRVAQGLVWSSLPIRAIAMRGYGATRMEGRIPTTRPTRLPPAQKRTAGKPP